MSVEEAAAKEPTTPAEIEQKLAQTRLEMTATVDELVSQLDPRKQAKALMDNAKTKVGEAVEYARETVESAKAGEGRAIGVIVGVAAVTALLGGLVVRRVFKR